MSALPSSARAVAEALLALGGNVGDVRAKLDRAVTQLCDGTDVRLLARSSDYCTPPWGVKDQPPFVNLASRWRQRFHQRPVKRDERSNARSAAIARMSSAGVPARSTSTSFGLR
jgi:2-amino-4-hydroxy-6-hydroxymethyldihydropteridine diphosphokinase